MKKQATFILAIGLSFSYQIGALAQWDLGSGAANPMDSAGAGSAGWQPTTQPYKEPPQWQSQPTNVPGRQGYVFNTNPYSNIPSGLTAPYVDPVRGGGGKLPATSMPRLSPMQMNGLPWQPGFYNNLPLNLKGVVNGLPPTRLDSFVRNAGGHAEAIYGDEGKNSWPPQSGFGPAHTINAGIVGDRDKTLTTGHGSKLPTASGNGMSKSGPRHGNI